MAFATTSFSTDAMAGAVDHAGLRSDRLVEISSPTARQGRSGFDLFKAYTVSGVCIAVFQIRVAPVSRDGAFDACPSIDGMNHIDPFCYATGLAPCPAEPNS
jgi:hypothetical protein